MPIVPPTERAGLTDGFNPSEMLCIRLEGSARVGGAIAGGAVAGCIQRFLLGSKSESHN